MPSSRASTPRRNALSGTGRGSVGQPLRSLNPAPNRNRSEECRGGVVIRRHEDLRTGAADVHPSGFRILHDCAVCGRLDLIEQGELLVEWGLSHVRKQHMVDREVLEVPEILDDLGG